MIAKILNSYPACITLGTCLGMLAGITLAVLLNMANAKFPDMDAGTILIVSLITAVVTTCPAMIFGALAGAVICTIYRAVT